MELPYLSIWHLLVLPAAFLWQTQQTKRPFFGAALLVTLPLILLVPVLSQSFFGFFSVGRGLIFLASQAVIIAAAAVLAAYLYEQAIRPRINRGPAIQRHRYLLFLVGFIVGLIMFDVFNQPLVTSLVVGMAINLLLAVRYYSSQLNEIIFSLLLMAVFYLFIYTAVLFDLPGETSRFWINDQLSGSVWLGIPIEKIIVVMLYGAFWGPVYIATKDVLAKN